jgi:D-alanyl-D-alanine carboxypeptidase/D-alanyl-D-alanine-endopeptidase (penicillin-binding protein 4)
VQIERAIGSKAIRMYGAIAVDEKPDVEELAIDDPAEYAAIALKGMLEERGVKVDGVARAKHVLSIEARGFQTVTKEPLDISSLSQNAACVAGVPGERVLAVRESAPLDEDVVVTNKVSQNLHAELLLRQLSTLAMGPDCEGSIVEGARVVRTFLTTKVGIDKDDFVFFDGSGLSGHDLVTPRATAKLLEFAVGQTWFADWKKSLPVGGEDGTLVGRFPKAPLKDHLFAKTGTLGEARALSGYLECASGKTVIFSIMVGNHAPGSNADVKVMDRIVAAIAAAN